MIKLKRIKQIIKEDKVFIITLVLIILLFNIHLPYYISIGGGTIDISNRIKTNDNKSINGSLNLLYVSELEATVPTYLLSFLMKEWEVEKVSDQRLSNESTEEIYERNRIMLNNSIQNATFVAYNKAGKNIDIKDYKNYVIGTTKDLDIKIGDNITEVDGKKVNNIKEIKEIITSHEVGDTIDIKLLRENKEKTVSVKVNEENNNKIIGIVVTTIYDYDLDPSIKLKFKKSESGSSGGLMLALSIYDMITDADLINGRKIAGTGTIDIDGNVGEIDGIKYKLMGAVKKKMDIVLVPKANYEEAIKEKKKNNYDIDIVSIEKFDDAIEYLSKEN